MTSETDPLALLPDALAAVADACRITRHVQQSLEAVRQHTKDDRSPVTVADYAAQALIGARLARAAPAIPLVGEEDASALRADDQAALAEAVTDAVRVAWPEADPPAVLDAIDSGNHDASGARYWTLDPIDGTKGFLRGGQYAVSLALIVDGRVVLGVLGCPNMAADFDQPFDQPAATGCLFHAVEGGGSWARPDSAPAAEPQPLRATVDGTLARMRVCESVESGHSRLDDTARIVQHLGSGGAPARLDSQCKYAVVARGQADAYLRLPTRRDYVEKIWDHAAGKLIAEQAGATVTDIVGRPLDFSHGTGLAANRGVICAPEPFHAAIIGAIEELGLFRE
ncbi:MAG: 3'(2'),5'-bisphosphate nucleotidase [Gammaproteobacteria bacterium]